MLNEIGTEIKGKFKARQRSRQLKKLDKKLCEWLDTWLKWDSIIDIKDRISKSLSEVLISDKDGPISSELFQIIRNIRDNLNKMKDNNVFEGAFKGALWSQIQKISFAASIKIGGHEIINTGKPSYLGKEETEESIKGSYLDKEETEKSIKGIETSMDKLTEFKKLIPTLEKRFEENVSTLTKISQEKERLERMNDLKANIKKIMDTLSKIISKSTPTSLWDDESINTWEDLDSDVKKLWDEYFNMDKTEIYTVSTNSHMDIPNDWVIKDRVDFGSIDTAKDLYDKYNRLFNDVNQQIENLGYERNVGILIKSLAKDKIEFHDTNAGFLPFSEEETVVSVWNPNEISNEISNLLTVWENRLTQLKKFKESTELIEKRYKENKKKLENIWELQDFHKRINNGDDIKKIDAMVDICENVLRLHSNHKAPEIKDQTIKLWWSLQDPNNPILLNFVHLEDEERKNRYKYSYSLSSSEWRDADWKDIKPKVKWIGFDQAKQVLLIKDIMIDPIDWVKFPVDLCLNIWVEIKDGMTWLAVKHEKPMILTVKAPELTQDDCEAAYDDGNIISTKIANIYTDAYREDLENEIILNLLMKWVDQDVEKDFFKKPKVDTISEIRNRLKANIPFLNKKFYKNDAEKNKLISDLRNRLKAHIPFLKLDDLQKWFRDYITSGGGYIPYKDLANKDSFKKYVETNLDNLLKDYAQYKIYKKVSEYHDDIILWTYWRNSISKRIKKSESNFNNYTALLKWKSSEFETKNWNKLKIEVKWIDKIIATITINGIQEEIDVANHDKAIEYILNKATARDGSKLEKEEACRLALCVLKAMTKISPKKLNKQISTNDFYGNSITNDKGDKITLNNMGIDLSWTDNKLKVFLWKIDTNKQNRQEYKTIFDEDEMDGIDRSDQNKVNEMEDKIRMVSTQINTILNSFAKDYQKGLDKKLLRYNTAERLQKGSIKKLLWKNKDINNYDFNTKVSHLWKDIDISFSEGKFIVTWEFEGQEYKYEAKNLGYILRKEINWKRVFDGIELEIINQVNEEYVKQLRNNDSINSESFAIADLHEHNAWRIYIFDSVWDLSYIEVWHERYNPLKKVNAWRINPSDIAVTRHRCNDKERKEFFQNPLLAWRLIREMKRTSRLLSFNKISKSKIARSRKKAVLKKMWFKRTLKMSTMKAKQKFKESWIWKLSSKIINWLSNRFPKIFDRKKPSITEKNKSKMINENENIVINSKPNTGWNP